MRRPRTASRAVLLREAAAVALFLLLSVAAASKLANPIPAARFLSALFSVYDPAVVRAVGVGEGLLALWLLSGLARRPAALVAACAFVVFTVVHAHARALPTPPPPCGCMGSIKAAERVTPAGWIALNAACAALAGLLHASSPRPQPRDTPVSPSTEAPTP